MNNNNVNVNVNRNRHVSGDDGYNTGMLFIFAFFIYSYLFICLFILFNLDNRIFTSKIVIIFLFFSLNMCFGCSKEPFI